VSATVAAPSTMEPATAMGAAAETTAAVETTGAASETAATVETAGATAEAGTTAETTAASAEATAIEATATAETASATSESRPVKAAPTEAATVESTTSIETMEPRASPDEESVYKPIGAVVAVRCAIVGVIAVVAVGASRTWTQIDRVNSNANRNLRMGRNCRREHTNCQ
jgi:hypothetical protein